MNPVSIVDSLLAVLIGMLALGGMSRGLVRGLANWALYAAAFWIALQVSVPIGTWIEQKLGAEAAIRQYVETRLPPGAGELRMSSSAARESVQHSDLPAPVKEKILSKEMRNQTVAGAIAAVLGAALAKVCGFLVVLYGVQLVGSFLLAPAVAVLRAVLPQPLDAAGGLLLGLGTAFLELTSFVVALPFLEHTTAIPPVWLSALKGSAVLQWVSTNGKPLADWIGHVLFTGVF